MSSKRKSQVSGPEVATVQVRGDFLSRTEVYPTSSMSLVLGMGEVDDHGTVFLPFIDLRLFKERDPIESAKSGMEDSEREIAISSMITFENAAFLLMDIAVDLKKVIIDIDAVSRGPIIAEPSRQRYALSCLVSAQEAVRESIEILSAKLAETADAKATVPKSASRKSGTGSR